MYASMHVDFSGVHWHVGPCNSNWSLRGERGGGGTRGGNANLCMDGQIEGRKGEREVKDLLKERMEGRNTRDGGRAGGQSPRLQDRLRCLHLVLM